MVAHDTVAAIQGEEAERIQSLDILRGMALLGMFVVHFHDRSTDPGGIDELVRTLIWRLVEIQVARDVRAPVRRRFRDSAQTRRRAGPAVRCPLSSATRRARAVRVRRARLLRLQRAAWLCGVGRAAAVDATWSTRALLLAAVLSAASVSLYRLAAA